MDGKPAVRNLEVTVSKDNEDRYVATITYSGHGETAQEALDDLNACINSSIGMLYNVKWNDIQL